MQSYILDFRKSPSFMKRWNKEFDVEDFGTTCFNLVLVDDICDDNIKDCLNGDGQLKYDDTHFLTATCSLEYQELDPNDLTNEDAHIVLTDDVSFDLTDTNFSLKGIFITTDSGYVMGYNINTTSINITNEMIFEEGLILFDIMEGGVING